MTRTDGKRTRLVDIANEAGVSIMAVSHVLHGTAKGRISVGLDKAERIRSVAQSMNYVPNHVAKQLVSGKSDLIGVLAVSSFDSRSPVVDPAWSVLSQFEFGQSPTLVRRTSCDRERITSMVRDLTGRGIRGLVVMIPDFPSDWEGLGSALDTDVPTLCIGRPPMEGSVPCVDVDVGKGVERLVRHLTDSGRSRVGIELGDRRLRSTVDRYSGYRRGLEGSGLSVDESLIHYMEVSAGQHRWSQMGVDAVIARDDAHAMAMMAELAGSGVRVPKDVLVAGQGNRPVAASSIPSLTTIDFRGEVFATVVDDLMKELLNGGGGLVRSIRITPELVIRESTSFTDR